MTEKESLKVIFLGRTMVGKTSIINAYFNQPVGDQVQQTIVPAYSCVELADGGREVVLKIWDTAGEEKYRSISKIFYRGAEVAVICCGMDDRESVRELLVWRDAVLEESPTCNIIYVLNKTDLEDRMEIRRLVDETLKDQGCCLFTTSALNNDGIKELFQEISLFKGTIHCEEEVREGGTERRCKC